MRSKSPAIAPRGRLRFYLCLAIGNLLAAVIFNPPAPARAYEGLLEMFGQAWETVAHQNLKAETSVPVDNQGNPRTEFNPWQPYAPNRVVAEAEYARLRHLKLPQRRDTLTTVIGAPRQVNYASVYGYEQHRLFNSRTLEITYQHGPDQRGQKGWVAIAVEVR